MEQTHASTSAAVPRESRSIFICSHDHSQCYHAQAGSVEVDSDVWPDSDSPNISCSSDPDRPSWIDMVEEQELMECLNLKKAEVTNNKCSQLQVSKLTDSQKACLSWMTDTYSFPMNIWNSLMNTLVNHPRLLDQYSEFTLTNFAKQTPLLMERALGKWQSYDLSKFRNAWDLLHVCVLYAMYQ
ncbi:uncharacterized protein LOC100368339 [Saccoglossus kowalevskii]|uniref:Uncharacterized protein LOC100368339 n=1 Tax=Saccoglossus kowalevskii TaxID=10224 RepID=A0ABM0GUS7_SACKO|nr:PREDICTED: uncharacterized protein LOC100368339 [Saccoglossus kowalevskii]